MECAGTLRAQEHGHQPLVFENHGQDAYLEESNVTMDEFFAQAAQNQLHPQIPGIGAKLKTEIEAYLEEHGMAMDEFIAMAAQDELHPKTPEVEVKDMGNLRREI